MEADNANPVHDITEFLPGFVEEGTNIGVPVPSVGKAALGGSSTASVSVERISRSPITIITANLSSPKLLGKDILVFGGPSELGQMASRLGSTVFAFQTIRKRLVSKNLDFTSRLEISRDPEESSSGAMLVAVTIHGMPYEKILSLWDDLSSEFAESLGEDSRGKVHLVLRSGE